jgi:hypothetical protein
LRTISGSTMVSGLWTISGSTMVGSLVDMLATVVSIFHHLPIRFWDDFRGQHGNIDVMLKRFNGVRCQCRIGAIGSSKDRLFGR